MDFLGTPGIGPLVFFALTAASFVAALVGVVTGAAGGVVLLGLMAMVMPPAAVIPVHTVVMLGSGLSRSLLMWRHIMRGTLIPFIIGGAIGAALGAKIFISLSVAWLQLILGAFILLVTWVPNLGRLGAERGRFAVLGFSATFLGVFVSATGTLVAPVIASAAKDRHVHVATMGALMMFAHILKMIAFGFVGFAIASYVPLMIAMIAAGAVGTWLGEIALHHMPEQRFRLILQVVLTALGLRLIWGAARGMGWF